MSVLVSCEAGGNAVPTQFIARLPAAGLMTTEASSLAASPSALLCDEPAKYVAERMATRLRAPLVANEYSLDLIDLCLDWVDAMYEELPMLRVRRNYPRRGTTDSITKTMRGEFSADNYLGIELLLNRAWAARSVAIRDNAIDGICRTLESILGTSHCEAA